MSTESHDRMLKILTEVDELKAKEIAIQAERKRHQAQIAQSEADLQRTESDIVNCRDVEARLKKELTDLRDEIFARPEDEEVITKDATHVPTDGEDVKNDTPAKRAWDARAKHLKSI
jgi:hypothetical protein